MIRFALAAAVCLSLPLFGQGRLGQEFNKHWNTSKEFTIAVAQAMPEANYGFKPNPEEMSFSEVMTHIGASNAGACAAAGGEKSPLPRPANADKATAVKYLNDTFDYCAKIVGGLTEEGLDKMIGPEGRQVTVRERLWGTFTHTAHHRGQAEVYLRVKEVKPPAYKF